MSAARQNKRNHALLNKVRVVPRKPGVYLFRDERNTVLYVGKAKQLNNRIRSYFQQSSSLDFRKSSMVANVRSFEYIVTENELEALVLEANLIKRYRPRFNVLLRDDKSYPYLKLTVNEAWPRVEVVRRVQKDGARYFGPYVPSGPMWNILSFIRNHYGIRTCGYSLEKRMRPCIQYEIKKCTAPCAGTIDRSAYLELIKEVRLLLEGKNKGLTESLEKRMRECSEEMRYEEAALLRDRIQAIRKISEAQKAVAPGLGDVDVIGYCRKDGTIVYKVLFIRNGIMIGSRDLVFRNVTGETDGYLMKNLIEQFYSGKVIPPAEIVCSTEPEDAHMLSSWLSAGREKKVKITVPERGIRKKLAGMAEENAASLTVDDKDARDRQMLEGLAGMLRLSQVPEDIGAFDISTISGTTPVGAFVYWADGEFRKDRYRHIRLDAVPGPDDYAMMREMVRRTLGKEVVPHAEGVEGARGNEGTSEPPAPDLLLIDGGRGHLDAVVSMLEEGGISYRDIIAVAKDPDRAFLKEGGEPLVLDDGSPSSLLLKKVRDEAHRFAVSYHKKVRSRKVFESPLEKIPGVAKHRRFALLRHFGSIDAIRKSSVEEIAKVKGFNRTIAARILESLAEERKG